MREIKTKEAVGHVLCHDITQIIRGVRKGRAFQKGHIVKEEDIPVLLSLGKEHLYVWEKQEGMLHENEGAEILRKICQGAHLAPSPVREGKIELTAQCDGLLKINREKLLSINALGEMMVASRHGDFPVRRGDKVAGMRVIPLVIREEKMKQAEEIAGGDALFHVKPFQKRKAGIVTTGSEVYYHRIEDTFTPVVAEKFREYGVSQIEQVTCSDDPGMITESIQSLLGKGCDIVVCTGGMSVDPDDRTPLAIKNTGAEVVSYGAPVLPGAMFLLAYEREGRPVLGLPGCVMYARRTIFDLVLPRLLCGERVTGEDLVRLGEGGLCLNCPTCIYPACGFGKG